MKKVGGRYRLNCAVDAKGRAVLSGKERAKLIKLIGASIAKRFNARFPKQIQEGDTFELTYRARVGSGRFKPGAKRGYVFFTPNV